MTLLISATLKVSLLLLVALTATAVLRRRSAALRHWVLTIAILCSISVPLLGVLLPAWAVPLPEAWLSPTASSSLRFISETGVPNRSPVDVAAATRAIPSGTDRLETTTLAILTVWLSGVAAGLLVLASGLVRLARLKSRSTPLRRGRWRAAAAELCHVHDLRRPIQLLHCPHPTMLVTWGTRRPTILLPACARDWSNERMRVVLHHELAHIRRGDWMITLAATVLRSVYWFNPLLWIACRQLRHESERACDDFVLTSGVSGADYATHLVGVARESADRRRAWSPAIAIARPSTLEGRVRAMLNATVNREPLTRLARAATLALVVAATLPIALVSLSGRTLVPNTGPDVALASPALLPDRSADALNKDATQPPAESSLAAQAAAGTIEGVLYDQFGGLLPGVAVRLTHRSTGGRYTTGTDPSGAFAFRTLPPGDYELTTALPGFTTVTNLVGIAAGETIRRQITLPIGTLEETIHVTCERSPVGVSPGSGGRTELGRPLRTATPPTVPQLFSGGIGGQIKVPRKLLHVNPVCPAGAQAIPAVVVLAGRVGIDGFLSDLRDTSAEPHPALVASAMDAARQWEFTPTLLNGVPIEVNLTITVSYGWVN